jgi:ABC-type lipoprotein release transport system permease subunit
VIAAFTIRLAWRNIWRRKRRTLITAAAIALVFALSLFMRSMQEGSYALNLENSTRIYSGYIQLQHPDFKKNSSIDELLPQSTEFIQRINDIPDLISVVPRLESVALASAGSKSKGVVVMGVSPTTEDHYSNLADRVAQGEYFVDNGKRALIGGTLARHFGLNVGDDLVLYGQGYHGTTAAGIFPIAGILDYPNPQLDGRIVYLPLAAAQTLYDTGPQVTAWVLHGSDYSRIDALTKAVKQQMGPQVAVRTWDELAPELAQQIALDRASGQFLVLVLYGVVGFGLFATIAMMTLERQREFAVMLATGMKTATLRLLVITEAAFIALIGIGMGLAVALPVLTWFYHHPIPLTGETGEMMSSMGWEPIIPFSLSPSLFIGQGQIVLVILCLCLLYPLAQVRSISLAAALKG